MLIYYAVHARAGKETSCRNKETGAEMEENPRLQNANVARDIIEIVSPVVGAIIYVATSPLLPFLLQLLILIIVLLLLFWIASKCNYQVLGAILVHYNAFLSTLWFLVYYLFCILSWQVIKEKEIILAAVITGFVGLISVIFATGGSRKSPRNVALSARSAKSEDDDALMCFLSLYQEPLTLTDLKDIELFQAIYKHSMQTKR